MTLLEAILQRFRDRMMRMRAALDRFNDESAEREKIGPKWNVRDLVGHYLFWTTEAAERLPEITRASVGFKQLDDDSANAKQVERLLPPYDLDRVNDEVYKKYRRMSFVMLLPQLRAAEERMLQALARVDPKQLVGETPLRTWVDIHLDHYEKHWTGLKSATDRL
ncbi:MAG: maleylpyruvate isomerase N-terminal domain-containing protein [Planctomycetes bacterium]|nr:maleylpyruvate isomerase N-terminal domain-containing protein [Planctomycetota bacterium]